MRAPMARRGRRGRRGCRWVGTRKGRRCMCGNKFARKSRC